MHLAWILLLYEWLKFRFILFVLAVIKEVCDGKGGKLKRIRRGAFR